MKKERAERTRFAILDLGDFDAYKAEHVTLTEQEQREDTKRKIPSGGISCKAVSQAERPSGRAGALCGRYRPDYSLTHAL